MKLSGILEKPFLSTAGQTDCLKNDVCVRMLERSKQTQSGRELWAGKKMKSI